MTTPISCAEIVSWLRDRRSQFYVINLTMAMRNGDVIGAMNKCADLIELGALAEPLDDWGMPLTLNPEQPA